MKRRVKLILDVCMTLLMVAEMAYLATDSAFHEGAGMALFGLFLAHHLLNGAWHRRILKGKYNLMRGLMAALDIVLTVLMLVELVTSILISEELFPMIGQSGGMEPRQLHTFAAYWGLLIMGAHLGLHWGVMLNGVRKHLPCGGKARTLCARIIAMAPVVLGAFAFVRLEMGAKLTMYYTFSYFDPDSSVLRYLLDFFLLMCAAAVMGYYGMKAAARKKHLTNGG